MGFVSKFDILKQIEFNERFYIEYEDVVDWQVLWVEVSSISPISF